MISLTSLTATLTSPVNVRRGTFAVSAVLAGMIGYVLAGILWHALPASHVAAPPPAYETRQGGSNRQSDSGQRLMSMQLLGQAEPLGQVSRQVPVNAPETRLNLTLRGLYYSASQQNALAIIGEGNRPETFFRVGDQVPGGATISAIYADRVILMRSGRHETLTLPDQRLEMEPGAATASLPSGESASDDDDGNDDRLPPTTEGSITRDSNDLTQMRRQMLRNPASITRYIQPEPFSENGNFVGFRLQPGEDNTLMRETGLEPGDVVTSINGNALSSPEAGMRAMQRMARSDSVQLEILRNGSPQSIHIDLNN